MKIAKLLRYLLFLALLSACSGGGDSADFFGGTSEPDTSSEQSDQGLPELPTSDISDSEVGIVDDSTETQVSDDLPSGDLAKSDKAE